ncbi:hypothetical protein [Streptomyces sp. NPDC059080]|uniref:hypothetical protein n=1 Tax=Streptomyces sp. NPDC059080 TaxID=3346718 RepID=UPI0036AAD772
MSGAISKKDQDLQNAMVILEGQMEKMRRSGQRVSDIVTTGVASNFQSQASTQFQQKMQQWIEAYNQVSTKVNNLHANLQQANQVLNSGADEAQQHAAGWGGDLDNIQSIMGGKS